MSLTDNQIRILARKMSIPLEGVCFKDQLVEHDFKYNRAYIVNMQDSMDENGRRNGGSHWVCFAVVQHQNKSFESMYFDSFGLPAPKEIDEFIEGVTPYNSIDIQGLSNGACGFYCLAFLHFCFASEYRTLSLLSNATKFIGLFADLNKFPEEWKYNEYVLQHFFRSSDENERQKNPVKPFDFKWVETDISGVANPDTINSIKGDGLKITDPIDGGKIYVLEPTTKHPESDVYIGSTFRDLDTRMIEHKSHYRQWVRNKKPTGDNITCFYLFEKYGINNVDIRLIENDPDIQTEGQLLAKESRYINDIPCCNKSTPNKKWKSTV